MSGDDVRDGPGASDGGAFARPRRTGRLLGIGLAVASVLVLIAVALTLAIGRNRGDTVAEARASSVIPAGRLAEALAAAPDGQRSLLNDGRITDEELQTAITSTKKCVVAAGLPEPSIDVSPGSPPLANSAVSSAPLQAGSTDEADVFGRCAWAHLAWVQWGWQYEHSPRAGLLLVFLQPDASLSQIEGVRSELEGAAGVQGLEFVDKDATFEEFKALNLFDPSDLATVSRDAMPPSFRFRPSDPTEPALVSLLARARVLPGVREIIDAGELPTP